MTPEPTLSSVPAAKVEIGQARHPCSLQLEGRWDDGSNVIKSALLLRIAPLHEEFETFESRAGRP